MSKRYEIMTLTDQSGRDRGAVFVCKKTKRVLDLELFTEAEDAKAFEAWLTLRGYGGIIRYFSLNSILHLEPLHDEWIKAKQESALAALGDAIDA